MRVLAACEESQAVCKAFRALGHEAFSCDLLPSSGGHPEWHIQDDVLHHIYDGWDLMIAFPPCTYLCSSGLHWNKRIPQRAILTENAIEFVKTLWGCGIPKIAIENPIGCLSTRMCKPSQIIQPYNFGEDASKQTCLWLKGLPLLGVTSYVKPRIVNGKQRWSNQTDSGQNKLGPSETRAMERSKTFPGIARAMAEQWNDLKTIAA